MTSLNLFFFETFYVFTPQNLLSIMLLLALLTIVVLYLLNSFVSTTLLYQIGLASAMLSIWCSLILWFQLDLAKGGFQAIYTFYVIPSFSFEIRLGVDGVSIFFLILTNLFTYLCILSLSPSTLKLNEALIYLFLLQWSVLASFVALDLLGFFIFFEISLIPIYFLVLIWGSRERKVRASYLISIYTLLGSIFMFFNILYIYSKTGTTDYESLLNTQFSFEDQLFLWITFFIAFASKIPVFPLHIWLPEAHVEAPTIGSVMLAVLLLKLGTYGLIRFCLPLFPEGTIYFAPLVAIFAVLGIIYTCLTAIRQIDLKKIIAYSSVGHMNIVLLGILSGNLEALQGAIFQMLSHGIVSGALFFGVGVIYERYSVRSIKYFGGLAFFCPIFAILFLIFSLANISFPLTSSFIGEFLIFMGVFQYNIVLTLFACTSMVLGAVYTLWTYNRIFFGNVKVLSLTKFKDINKKEFTLFGILVFILFLMGVAPYIFLDAMFLDCLNILEHAKGNRIV